MEEFYNILQHPVFVKLASIFILFVVIYFAVRVLKNGAVKLVNDNETKYKFRKLVSFLGYIAFFIGLMFIFNTKFSGIGTALGVAGAGIAFALQEVIVSVAGYITIFTGRFFKVGDRIKLGSVKGDVIDIGLLRTTLMEIGDWVNGDLYNGKMVRVANSFVFKDPVYNYSGDFPFLWDELIVPVKTNSDFKYTKELFENILKEELGDFANNSQAAWDKMIGEYNIENAKVQPMVTMLFNENWITFTLRYVVDFKSRRITKSNLSEKILSAINASNGKVEVASAAIEITAFPKNSTPN
ncbi:Small-conductance mechanosensitive channel [Kordia antarctica]|uniref:Small-conductance mechanosensitive channel n=1 Tax=Kordia antarctica TaxID=1218801 RepID=A0A7L4ZR45_9FLAO|nr:mechanosensitive ion channel family protein [Kordia antarctica]QHI39125.1 Small-conductance mechanosensitive channel [Kordia antarctica]